MAHASADRASRKAGTARDCSAWGIQGACAVNASVGGPHCGIHFAEAVLISARLHFIRFLSAGAACSRPIRNVKVSRYRSGT
jgi:hypothetical protein